MTMVGVETLGQWAAALNGKAQDFGIRQSPETARDILVLCACVESAVTGYLIKQKLEGMINGQGRS